MKTQKFGIEIELTGITRESAVKTVATYFGTTTKFTGDNYLAWMVHG